MRTLADFKKRLIVGVKLHTIYHQRFAGRDTAGNCIWEDQDLGIREVSIKQTNSFAMKTQQTDKVVDSWCAFPKASECKILDENTIQILQEDGRVREDIKPLIPILTYKFVQG